MKYIIKNTTTGLEQTYSSKDAIRNEFNVSKLKITQTIKTNAELAMPNGDVYVIRSEGTPYGKKSVTFSSSEIEIAYLQKQNEKLQTKINDLKAKFDSNTKRIENLQKTTEARKLIDAEIEALRQAKYAELEKLAA